MSGHTPGPWGLVTVPTSCGSCHKIGPFPARLSSPERLNYACVYSDNVHVGREAGDKVGAELLANARLMAAAPALLAKVQEFAGCCAECDGEGGRFVEYDDDSDRDPVWTPCADCADIREVIALATTAPASLAAGGD